MPPVRPDTPERSCRRVLRGGSHRFGARAAGTTLSAEQAQVARDRRRALPVEIRVLDYRDGAGRFAVKDVRNLGPDDSGSFRPSRSCSPVSGSPEPPWARAVREGAQDG